MPMIVEETMKVQIKFPNAKERQAKSWDLARNKPLREGIEECLATGRAVFKKSTADSLLYHIEPIYPWIPEHMAKPEVQAEGWMQVYVKVYSQSFCLGVKDVR